MPVRSASARTKLQATCVYCFFPLILRLAAQTHSARVRTPLPRRAPLPCRAPLPQKTDWSAWNSSSQIGRLSCGFGCCMASGKELWHLKENLGSLLWEDIRLALGDSVTADGINTMQAELFQTCNQPGEIVGVFPVGAPLAETQLFDIRFRPCLNAFRARTLFKQHISPALKAAGGQVQAWIPLSQAESQKKRKRQGSNPPETTGRSPQPNLYASRAAAIATRAVGECRVSGVLLFFPRPVPVAPVFQPLFSTSRLQLLRVLSWSCERNFF